MAEPAVKLIVGLGNPGPEYADTRHNAGAWLVDRLAHQAGGHWTREDKFHGHTSRITLNGADLRLLVPATYMNLSGKSVGAMATFYKILPEEILVVHDELDLPPGTAKLKRGGGHGGHNGLKDILRALGNNPNFLRLRVGIGHPGQASLVTGFVLGKPPRPELELIEQSIDKALDALPHLVRGDLTKAMNHLHTNR